MVVEVDWAKVHRISDIPLQHLDKTAYINRRNRALPSNNTKTATPSRA